MDENTKDLLKQMQNWDGDWDQALTGVSVGEQNEAKFDVVVSRVQAVIRDWMETPIWAMTPEEPEEPMKIGMSEFDDSTETRLGELASVQILGLLAMLCVKSGVEIDPRIMFENKELILDVVAACLTEGIMIGNAPGWSDKMDAALGDVRQSCWSTEQIIQARHIIEMRDESGEEPE